MTGNGWGARVVTLAMFICCAVAHSSMLRGIPNTPAGMFEYHSSAALVDGALAICCTLLLSGRLLHDMQMLCIASMSANFIGWILYLLYLPPIIYNGTIWIISGAQLVRLFVGGAHDAGYPGEHVVRGSDTGNYKFRTGEADK